MDLGIRQIRTAGKGSGSIEVTLPAGLRDLVGLSCRILLHDGARPHIALQPDLSMAQRAFSTLWHAMAHALFCEGALHAGPRAKDHDGCGNAGSLRHAPPRLELADFNLGFRLPAMAGPRPFLCWRDGLVLCSPPPHAPLAIARTLAAFGQAQAGALGIVAPLAAGFGAACGFLATGLAPSEGEQESCDLIAFLLLDSGIPATGRASAGPAAAGPGAPLRAADAAGQGAADVAFWTVAGPLFAAAGERFRSWSVDPSSYGALQAAWRRGRSIELSGD